MLKRIDMDLSTVDTDGIFDGLTGAGPWDSSDWKESTQVNGGAPDGLAHRLNFTSGDDLDAITATVVGTDADDYPQTEDVTLPDNGTTESAKYFKTVTDLSVSASLTSNTLDVGYVDEAVSPSIPLNHDANVPSNWFLDITGTIALDVQFTFSDLTDRVNYVDQNAATWVEPEASLTNESADSTDFVTADAGWSYARVQVNSYSTGAELQLYLSQALR